MNSRCELSPYAVLLIAAAAYLGLQVLAYLLGGGK